MDMGDQVRVLPLIQPQLPVHLRFIVHEIQIILRIGGVDPIRRSVKIVFETDAGGPEFLQGDEVAGQAKEPVRRQLLQPAQTHDDPDALLEPLHPVQHLRQGDGDLCILPILLMGRAQVRQCPDKVPGLRLTASGPKIEPGPLIEGEDVVPFLLHAPAPSRRMASSSALVKVYLLLQK